MYMILKKNEQKVSKTKNKNNSWDANSISSEQKS